MMHQESSTLFYIGGAAVLLASILWWKDVVDESKSGKFHNKVVQIGLRYGMILFIASEVMFFSAWFWASLMLHFTLEQTVQVDWTTRFSWWSFPTRG